MNYLIAPDSFKGSLTSSEAAETIASALRKLDPGAGIRCMPMADGGEGTLDVLAAAWQDKHARRIRFCHTALRRLNAEYLLCPGRQAGEDIALIESARLIGLGLQQESDVMRRGSIALGYALSELLASGIRRLVIALGGSGCNDGGLGMLTALGLRAWDGEGKPVEGNLSGLLRLRRLDTEKLSPALRDAHIVALCDVDARLTGEYGASRRYGPQKGLDRALCLEADRAMARFAELAEKRFAVQAKDKPGSGAAGGIGFALALLGARLQSGAAFVIRETGFAQALRWADWLITGEGASDAQTLQGKLPLLLAKRARSAGKKAALISGRIEPAQMQPGRDRLARYFDRMIAVHDRDSLAVLDMRAYTKQQARRDLRKAAAKLIRLLSDENAI